MYALAREKQYARHLKKMLHSTKKYPPRRQKISSISLRMMLHIHAMEHLFRCHAASFLMRWRIFSDDMQYIKSMVNSISAADHACKRATKSPLYEGRRASTQ